MTDTPEDRPTITLFATYTFDDVRAAIENT